MRTRGPTTLIGRGIAFPLRTDSRGGLATVEELDDVDRAVRLIVGTAPGERPMRPEFGCALHAFVFAPISDTTIGAITFEVERSVARWEPRVDVTEVTVHGDEDDENVLYIELTYRVKRTNDERNLVFPFYVIPDQESVGPATPTPTPTPTAEV